jgi:hypothetical protein
MSYMGECNMHVKVSRRLVFIPTVDASVPSLRHGSIGYDTISLTGIDHSCIKHWRSGAFWYLRRERESDVLESWIAWRVEKAGHSISSPPAQSLDREMTTFILITF